MLERKEIQGIDFQGGYEQFAQRFAKLEHLREFLDQFQGEKSLEPTISHIRAMISNSDYLDEEMEFGLQEIINGDIRGTEAFQSELMRMTAFIFVLAAFYGYFLYNFQDDFKGVVVEGNIFDLAPHLLLLTGIVAAEIHTLIMMFRNQRFKKILQQIEAIMSETDADESEDEKNQYLNDPRVFITFVREKWPKMVKEVKLTRFSEIHRLNVEIEVLKKQIKKFEKQCKDPDIIDFENEQNKRRITYANQLKELIYGELERIQALTEYLQHQADDFEDQVGNLVDFEGSEVEDSLKLMHERIIQGHDMVGLSEQDMAYQISCLQALKTIEEDLDGTTLTNQIWEVTEKLEEEEV